MIIIEVIVKDADSNIISKDNLHNKLITIDQYYHNMQNIDKRMQTIIQNTSNEN